MSDLSRIWETKIAISVLQSQFLWDWDTYGVGTFCGAGRHWANTIHRFSREGVRFVCDTGTGSM